MPRDEFAARWTGLRRAVRLHAAVRARAESPRRTSPGCGRSCGRTGRLLWRALAPRGHRQRAADDAAGLHAGHRRSRAGRAGRVAAQPAHRWRWASRSCSSSRRSRRSATCCRSRRCASTPAALDYLMRRLLALPMSYFATPAHRRHPAPARWHPAGPRLPGAVRHRRHHRRRAARGHARADVRLQPAARVRLPGDGAALRAADARVGEVAAADRAASSRRRTAATTRTRSTRSRASRP